MDQSRGKRKSRTSQRGKLSRPVQKSDDSTLQATRERTPAGYLESKPQGKQIQESLHRVLRSHMERDKFSAVTA